MLEPIIKGLIEWIYGLIEDMSDFVFGDIIDVLTMDMSYFRKAAPIVEDITEIILALGWALLLGNLVFQLIKSIMSGAGFEGEDPKLLFMRTFAFAFLLLASPQICDMCSKMTGTVIAYLNIPRSFAFSAPTGLMFTDAGGVSWLLAIIVSIILIVQMVKLFFDIGERYVIACVLTFMAPLAFAMGGSKNTNDIFKGWCRMYGSMNFMLIMNIIFLKLIMNAMLNMHASNIIIWLVFVMALTRVARKIDAHIAKIGLNPAQTNSSVGVRFPGGMTMVVVRSIASLVGKNVGGMKGSPGGSNRSGGNGNHNHGGGPGDSPRNNPPSPNNGGNASSGNANVNVSVNNQSRTVKMSAQPGNIAGKQASGVTNNSRYTNNNGSDTNTRDNSRTDTSNRETSGRNIAPNPLDRTTPANKGGNVTVTQTRVQNAARNAASMPGARPNTSRTTTCRSSSETHNNSVSNIERDSYSASQQRTQNPSRPPLSRNTSGAKTNAPALPISSTARADRSVVNNNSGIVGGVNVNTSAGKTGANGITVPVMSQTQSMSRTSGNFRGADNRSVNNNVGGNFSADNDSDVHTSNVSAENGKADRRSTVIAGRNISANNVSGGNTEIRVNGGASNNTVTSQGGNVSNGGTVINNSGMSYSDYGGNSQYVANTNMSTTERRVDPEYKFGRYDPAAANRKGKKNYYAKDTEILKRTQEYERGERDNGRTAKKRNAEGSPRSAGRRRNR